MIEDITIKERIELRKESMKLAVQLEEMQHWNDDYTLSQRAEKIYNYITQNTEGDN